MFSREQIDTLYYLTEKGAVTVDDVNKFLQSKLVSDAGFVVTPPPAAEAPAPEQPAEPVPPTPEGEQPVEQPVA